MTTRHGWLRLLLVTLSATATLAALELGARLIAYRNDVRHLGSPASVPKAGEAATLGQMLRPSANRRIIYELLPGLSVRFMDQPVTTNARGFRDRTIAFEKPARTVRIVGLGDSIMFGWGVREEEGYLRVLGRLLQAKYPANTWEVVNTAVPGYNTVMEVETLKEKGLRHQPDLVVIQYVRNDLSLPNFIVDRRDYLSPRRSFLWSSLRGGLKPPELREAPEAPDGSGFENEPGRVPPEYRDLVGMESYRSAMGELRGLSEARRFEVVVLCNHFSRNAAVRDVVAGLGLPTLDTEAAWTRHCQENGIGDGEAAWRLSPTDAHPSAEGHRVMAEALLAHLEESGAIRRMMRE